MNNESIDFKAVFGDGAGFYDVTEVPNTGKPCLPIPCGADPADTPEETAYREGAEAMRREVLRALDVMGEEGGCTCLWHVEAAVRGVEW